MSNTEDNKRRVQAFFDALGAGDVDALVGAYHDAGVLETMGTTLISGRFDKAQISAAANGIFEAFPEGLAFTLHGMVAEGDKVAVEAESRGRHASGALYNNHYHFLFEFRDGRVLRLREYLDTELATDVLCGGQRRPGAAAP
jgi:ketosteroid isomerase-like protein